MARVAGLLAVAVLPALAGLTASAYAEPSRLSSGFHHAIIIAAVMCAAGGLLSAATVSNGVLATGANSASASAAATRTYSAVPVPHIRQAHRDHQHLIAGKGKND